VTTLEPATCDGQRDHANGARETDTTLGGLVRALGADSGISKSEVSGICADLDAEVGAFRNPQPYERPQNRFLFSGTVLDNIRFGRPDATRAEVEAAARAVGADQVLAGLPDGYDTQVGERGALLAAGERQLVAFARARIADPALLILDEATSNLDAASEARITDALQRLRFGRTTIIIAHRLSTIAQADQIAVVEDGRIVESGAPAGLRTRGGRFADLFDRWVAGAA
jgi:ATP-binding cassette subfamily B protein